MDRIKYALKLIDRSIERFSEFEKLKHAKNAYFENVQHFKDLILRDMNHLNIFNNEQIIPLKDSLNDVLLNKNKGGQDQEVYHTTWPKHGMVIAKLTELRCIAATLKLSICDMVIDFFWFSKREIIIALLAAIIGALVTYLIK